MTDVAERAARPAQVPHLVTELPGPKARAHIAFDEAITSPSLPRAYPIVPVRGDGLRRRGHRRQRLPRLRRRHRRQLDRPRPPRRAAGHRAAGASTWCTSARPTSTCPSTPSRRRAGAHRPHRAARTRVFLGNSGAEAVEAALKLARFHTRRQYVVAFLGAFHGRTYGAVSLTASKAKYHAGFGPLLPGVYPRARSAAPASTSSSSASSSASCRPTRSRRSSSSRSRARAATSSPTTTSCPRLRRICDTHGILLIADEVQSGAGRTGRMWAIEHWGVEPDIARGGQGHRLAACPSRAVVARAELMDWSAGAHGSTYGGNPVACAALLATIKLLEGGLWRTPPRRGEQALDGAAARSSAATSRSSATCAARAS